MSGWIKLHRAMLKWEWYDDKNTKLLFIHLLLKASHQTSKYRGHEIPIGSAVYGHDAYAEQLGLSVKQVRSALDKLKLTGEVAVKKTNKFSIVSICNWNKYQGEGQSEGQQNGNKKSGKGQPNGSIQEGKKERSDIDLWEGPNEKSFNMGKLEDYTNEEILYLAEGFKDYVRSKRGKPYSNLNSAFYNWIKSDISRRNIRERRRGLQASGNGYNGCGGGYQGKVGGTIGAAQSILDRWREEDNGGGV